MKAKFKKDHYIVIKNAISKDLAGFVYNYFLMKRQVARTLFDTRFISPFTDYFGVWNDEMEIIIIYLLQPLHYARKCYIH